MRNSWTIVFPEGIHHELQSHLFPGDQDEHGAVLAAGVSMTSSGTRLLVRDLFLAKDGVDYIPGSRGYRKLTGEFVTARILYCRDEKLVYLAVHNHGAGNEVAFSSVDLESHMRGYPALLDITSGIPVGALVFATDAVAGDIWISKTERVQINHAEVVGRRRLLIYPEPLPPPTLMSPSFDRQTRLFGDKGQAILQEMKVGVIGLGGVGSLVNEYVTRLGVGHVVLVDPDRIEITNLSRVVGSTRLDTMSWLTSGQNPIWIRRIGERFSKSKVAIAKRVAKQSNPDVEVTPIVANVVEEDVARQLTDCDFLFLAADSMQARLVFNSLVHQYLIPGIQMGAKVRGNAHSGDVTDVYSVTRLVLPDSGCLVCNQLISSSRLQIESLTDEERRKIQYVEDENVKAPSVITLNALAASQAVNDFLFYATGLTNSDAHLGYVRFRPLDRDVVLDDPRCSAHCVECGHVSKSRLARGDSRELPTTLGKS